MTTLAKSFRFTSEMFDCPRFESSINPKMREWLAEHANRLLDEHVKTLQEVGGRGGMTRFKRLRDLAAEADPSLICAVNQLLVIEVRQKLPKILEALDVYEMAMEQVEDCCPNSGEIAAICAETLKRVEELARE